MGLLRGIDRMRDILIENTERFATGLPANNALLWGARHGQVVAGQGGACHRERDAGGEWPAQADRNSPRGHREPAAADGAAARVRFHFIVFCDDLSFDGNDASYKSLKAVLEGGIEGRPENVILYATSNRRHLLSRDMIENERSTAINPSEAVEEKVSLSDRFGLWLGFHKCSQDEYLEMVRGYCKHFGVKIDDDQLTREALEWSTTRGSRSAAWPGNLRRKSRAAWA
jgi:predicted AAA+ superfamily ATPase